MREAGRPMIPSTYWAVLLGGMALFLAFGIFESIRRFRSRNLGLAPKSRFALLKENDSPLTEAAARSGEIPRTQASRPRRESRPGFNAAHYSRETLESILLMVAIIGDFAMILLGF